MTLVPTTLTVTAALTAALLTGSAGGAVAAPTTSPDPTGPTTTITVSTAALDQLCDVRLPAMLTRAQDRLARIQGDASTPGSVSWVRARADKAAAEGHADLAARLRLRADQREGRVGDVTSAITRIGQVETQICTQRTGA